MGTIEDSVTKVISDYYPNHKSFWGSARDLPLGTGLVYDEIAYPLLNLESRFFDTVAGPVIVLTHECDISQENERYFNEELLVCPIIPFGDFVQEYINESSLEALKNNFLPALSKHKISRVMYVPSVNNECLPHGGIIYFNQMCSTHVSIFEKREAVCSITAPGLDRLSLKLHNHFLRPKSQAVPLTQAYHPSLFTEH